MKEFREHQVYFKVPMSECWDVTGKEPVGVKWIDINKGDEEKPKLRCRLVAQEFNPSAKDSIFAATPPLEAKKALFSMAVTEGIGSDMGTDGTTSLNS